MPAGLSGAAGASRAPNASPAPLAPPAPGTDGAAEAVARAAAALAAQQRADGHWIYEVEADATIPAEYVLLVHYLGEPADAALEAGIAAYLRRIQAADGGWPLFHGGASDLSASVKAYFALKTIGDDPQAPHMRRARDRILAAGGAGGVNVFTRILLALYGLLPWRAVPMTPVEIVLLPRRAPFHLMKMSYWSRTVLVPLTVLLTLKPRARNPRCVRLDELFPEPPDRLGLPPRAPHQRQGWFLLFRALDAGLRALDPLMPRPTRRRAIAGAVRFVEERLNGRDGLGAIFPAMANAVMMYDALGHGPDHPQRRIARESIDGLLVRHDDGEAYCQPCLSPVWDTALACHALLEAGGAAAGAQVLRGLDWLAARQVLEVHGDWAQDHPGLRPGGWAFQYANPHYPDLDDTAVVAMAMDRAQRQLGCDRYAGAIARAREWIEGMQCADGGWSAFGGEEGREFLNNIPFSDHGALLDPPTADLTARCISLLAQLGATPESSPALRRGLDWLLARQEAQGSWIGRWGVNHIYGTWSALCALAAAGLPPEAEPVRRAADWLLSVQNPDGSWGEGGDSYRLDYAGHEPAPGTPSQTAWAMLALMAAGRAGDPALARAAAWLRRRQGPDGLWAEPQHTGTGFPRVFYLRYHGYPRYFPLWALARWQRLRAAGQGRPGWGM